VTDDRDYVLGTHDEEVERLGVQHRIWRPRALDAWRRAGFTVGQTLLDVGCGPGWATVDLAEIVGRSGRALAADRSRRFLEHLRATCRARGIGNVEPRELDLDADPFPWSGVDGAWARWIFAFVTRPRALLARLRDTLRPGGVLVLHEYFAYSTWRFVPRCPEHDEFVRVVMASWRKDGGEPDIGLDLPTWLGELGFDILEQRPIVEIASPSSFLWQWPKTFLAVNVPHQVARGTLTREQAEALTAAFARIESTPGAVVVTPGVLEILAIRR
jgi:SAM-dependent methyltransferase